MGIKNLNNVIKTFSNINLERVHLKNFKDMIFAIDANLYIYRFLYGNGNHINGLFFMINKLLKYSITPFFIFDGYAPKEKQRTLKTRKNIKEKYKIQLIQLETELKINNNKSEILKKIANIKKKLVYINDNIIESAQQLFDYMGIGYLIADGEAEHLCAKLSKLNIVDGVISDDTDTLACGSNIVLREFTNKSETVLYYQMSNILYDMDINLSSLVDMCILLGNDYNSKVKGFTYQQIYELVKKYKSIESIINNTDINIHIPFKKIRDLYLLKDVKVNLNETNHQLNKSPLITSLINFLKTNSDIDKYTYLYRINRMFNDTNIKSNINITNKYNIFDSKYKIKLKTIH